MEKLEHLTTLQQVRHLATSCHYSIQKSYHNLFDYSLMCFQISYFIYLISQHNACLGLLWINFVQTLPHFGIWFAILLCLLWLVLQCDTSTFIYYTYSLTNTFLSLNFFCSVIIVCRMFHVAASTVTVGSIFPYS